MMAHRGYFFSLVGSRPAHLLQTRFCHRKYHGQFINTLILQLEDRLLLLLLLLLSTFPSSSLLLDIWSRSKGNPSTDLLPKELKDEG
jgi:hypothetical protein